MYFTKSALIVLLFSLCCYAPIPPCSPLRFINKIVESDELAWLLRDLPGHPVRPCPYENEEDAPAEERSLIAFFFGDTNRITDELRSESEFWTFKGFPRIYERFWNNFESSRNAGSIFHEDPEPTDDLDDKFLLSNEIPDHDEYSS